MPVRKSSTQSAGAKPTELSGGGIGQTVLHCGGVAIPMAIKEVGGHGSLPSI